MDVPREEPPHGRKRRADEELANDQRLVKRFNLLNLGTDPQSYRFLLGSCGSHPSVERNGKRYIPGDKTAMAHSEQTNLNEDSMQLDDTRDKVYIYNLDDELRGIEEEEEKTLFLPDIERKFTKIPKAVLTSTCPPLANQEMVLYRVPSSLTVPEEQDIVRKAIIETRERARQKQADDTNVELNRRFEYAATNGEHKEYGVPDRGHFEEDEDAMEIG